MDVAADPVLSVLRRGGADESWHRGSWVLVDVEGRVVDSRGNPDRPTFARSAAKSLQSLPLLETGAADRYGVTDEELAVVIASHHGEPTHVAVVASLLARVGLDESHLGCGPRFGGEADARLGNRPITDNCSGKHAGFLLTAEAMGDDVSAYLDPTSRVQRLVHRAVLDMSGAAEGLGTAVDGCGAPTFVMPLRSLATALARMATPDTLPAVRADACHRITRAAAAHPTMVGGSTGSFDTDLMRAAPDRVFAKGGAEGVHAIGLRGTGLGLAVKIDDGAARGLHHVVIAILTRFGHLDRDQLTALAQWDDPVLRNRRGTTVGDIHVPADVLP